MYTPEEILWHEIDEKGNFNSHMEEDPFVLKDEEMPEKALGPDLSGESQDLMRKILREAFNSEDFYTVLETLSHLGFSLEDALDLVNDVQHGLVNPEEVLSKVSTNSFLNSSSKISLTKLGKKVLVSAKKISFQDF